MNTLYPVFLKLEELNVLVVGGGMVAEEKLSFILKSSPKAKVHLVAKDYSPAVLDIISHYNQQTIDDVKSASKKNKKQSNAEKKNSFADKQNTDSEKHLKGLDKNKSKSNKNSTNKYLNHSVEYQNQLDRKKYSTKKQKLSKEKYERITYQVSSFKKKHLTNTYQLVIAATDNVSLNMKVYDRAKKKNILINVADNPPYCDLYLGGIVTKGDLKIAISTNGKSPTVAKQLRRHFESILPNDLDETLQYLDKYKKTLNLEFEERVKHLNDLTKSLIK